MLWSLQPSRGYGECRSPDLVPNPDKHQPFSEPEVLQRPTPFTRDGAQRYINRLREYTLDNWIGCYVFRTMSKLSGALKALIDAPFARAGTTPAPRHILQVYERIGKTAESRSVEQPIWLAMTVRIANLNSNSCATEKLPSGRAQ